MCIGWHLFQTNVVQALLHGSLDDVDLYIELPARYACPAGYVLKLRKAIYGLHPAVKFKQEVVACFLANGYMPAHDSETFWIKMVPVKLNWGGSIVSGGLIVHALYADDFLHFTDNPSLFQSFKEDFGKRVDVKSGLVSVYLGNKVDRVCQKVVLDQEEFLEEVLKKFGMQVGASVPTPMLSRLSAVNSGEKLDSEAHELYRTIVGSLLYLACWSRPDIAFAISDLSRFISALVSAPCQTRMIAAKHLLRPTVRVNLVWGYVDSDWA